MRSSNISIMDTSRFQGYIRRSRRSGPRSYRPSAKEQRVTRASTIAARMAARCMFQILDLRTIADLPDGPSVEKGSNACPHPLHGPLIFYEDRCGEEQAAYLDDGHGGFRREHVVGANDVHDQQTGSRPLPAVQTGRRPGPALLQRDRDQPVTLGALDVLIDAVDAELHVLLQAHGVADAVVLAPRGLALDLLEGYGGAL